MNKSITLVLVLILAGSLMAQQKGGFGPCLATCCIGPRVGLEMNEGVDLYKGEWIMLWGKLVSDALGPAYTTEMDLNKCIEVYPYPCTVETTPNPVGQLGLGIAVGTKAYMAYEMGGKTNGFNGFLASYFLGPRIGAELHERKIRTKEWLLLVPCACLYPAISIPLEAYRGKTMTEIEVAEGLRR